MYIYITIFIISFICSIIAEIQNKKNKRILFMMFSTLAIVIPSIIAGLRASGVGTDTQVYIDWVFRASVHCNNLKEAFGFINSSGIEPLYCLINYIVSRFSNNYSVMYFTLTFIFLIFSYIGCYKLSKKIKFSYSFAYLVLLFLFYNKSLNLCRQSLSMSICLFSVSYILTREWKKFFICMIVAFCFHRSVLLFIPLYFIYPLTINNTKEKTVVKTVIISLLLFASLFFKQIILALVNIGIISSKYSNYVYIFGNTNNVKLIELTTQIIILLIPLLLRKKLILNSKNNNFFIYLMLLAFVTFLFGFNGNYIQRISYYYSFTAVILIPQFFYVFKRSKDKILSILLTIIILCGYSYLYYEKYLFDQTVPYRIDISNNKIVK